MARLIRKPGIGHGRRMEMHRALPRTSNQEA